MSRIYHYTLVGLVSLLGVILVAFLLLFTDVGFSPTDGHIANGNIWAAKKLRVSAELAYYWRYPIRERESSPSGVQVQQERVGLTDSEEERYHSRHSERQETQAKQSSRPALPVLRQDGPTIHIHRRKDGLDSTTPSAPQTVSPQNHSRPITTKEPSTTTISTKSSTTFLERGKDLFVDGGSPAGTNTSMSTERGTAEEPTDADYGMLDTDREVEGGLSEMDDEYNTEEIAKNTSEEERDIRVAFMNDDYKEKEAEVIDFRNHSQVHLPSGYIKPGLIERASNVQFHMPCPKVYLSVPLLVMAPWMKPLLQILSSFEGKQITLVIANNAYRDVLLNWLISATIVSRPPIENILVVSLDGSLHNLLQSRDIPSILAPFGTVLNSRHRFRRFFELIMMMRLAFMRLINRLGYDCAMYDIDAIILKNPQPLYEKWRDRDIVGSRGELPRELWRRWGVTICIGAVFIRSNTRTEIYWEAVHAVRLKGGPMANDQIRLNHGLRQLGVEWEQDRQTNRLRQEDQPAMGRCSGGSELSVVVLPFGTVCRFGCRAGSRSSYYVWHKGGSRDKKSKMKGAKQGRTWFLKERWSELHSNMVVDVRGRKWLKRISTGV